MNTIVHRYYPTKNLPPELREGMNAFPFVKVTIVVEAPPLAGERNESSSAHSSKTTSEQRDASDD